MDNDDLPVGRIWSRRDVISLLSAAGAGVVLAACGANNNDNPAATTAGGQRTGTAATGTGTPATTPTAAAAGATPSVTTVNCVVTPELTEGPFFVDDMLDRSDIRVDQSTGAVSQGAELKLAFNVYEMNGSSCAPIPGAMVDAWHCDAAGVYSGVSDGGSDSRGQDFLRGFQRTDQLGQAAFTTIYPGWYQGRAVHIHFKVRGTNAQGRNYEFTSQLFFDEDTTDIVHAEQPYAAKGRRTLLNSSDSIFRSSNGQTLIDVARSGDAWEGTFNLGIRL
jgi:protocatechuate 3,4-dioxygenase beta subunit